MAPKAKKEETGDGKYRNLPTNFNQRQIDGLDAIAKIEGKRRSEIIRDAIDYYLLKHGKDQIDLHESKLVEQLKRVETGLRALIVKNARMTGEVMYWSSLQWKDGPPKARLNQEGFNQHMEKAKAFSYFLLNTKPRKALASEQEIKGADMAGESES